MTDHDQYFEYLQGRSALGEVYRRFVLYPRLNAELQGRLVDIGCGIGDMLAARPGSVGIDVNPRTVEHCRRRGLEAHLMADDRIPCDDATFGCALMDNVLEHIVAPAALLAETRRVVRPGGIFLAGVPGRRGYASDPDHKVFYDEASLVATVEAEGFRFRRSFHMPIGRSEWLSAKVRQYCVYASFVRG